MNEYVRLHVALLYLQHLNHFSESTTTSRERKINTQQIKLWEIFINKYEKLRKFWRGKTEIDCDKGNAELQRPSGNFIQMVTLLCFCLFLSAYPFLDLTFILSLSTAVKRKFSRCLLTSERLPYPKTTTLLFNTNNNTVGIGELSVSITVG
jgi:hypothetical protein